MFNPDHFKILQDALAKKDITIWNNWRSQNRTIRPELRLADFRDANLSLADFRDANLSLADFRDANLRDANLRDANLSDADLRSAKLIYAKLIYANLSDANLSSANLSDANLSSANLSDADFQYTNLINADFQYTNLINADLRSADLSNAKLSDANLSSAKLSHANFFRTILNNTILIETDLTNARFYNTIFSEIDLSTTKNLDQAKVEGPCTIGIDTIYKSQGKIPNKFLKDCGVPDILITYLPSLVEAGMSFYSCFISYSTSDEVFATKLFNALRDKGIRVWFAPDQLLPGQKLADQIDRGITHWDKVILCCSESSMTEKWWVDFEVSKTFSKSRRKQREWGEAVDVLIPLNLDGYVLTDEFQENNAHADVILDYFVEDCTQWEDDDAFNRMVERLVRTLREDGGHEPPHASS